MRLPILCILAPALAACSSPSSSPPSLSDSGVAQSDVSEDAPREGSPRACMPAGNPGTITITGTACGQSLMYQSPAQLAVDVVRSAFTLGDATITTAIEIGDGDLATALPRQQGYFDSHDVYANIQIDSPVATSGGTMAYAMSSGILEACGFGALAVGAGTISLTFSGGNVQAVADGLSVQAFDPKAFGSFQVAACSGTITLRFQGPWTAR